MRKAIQFIEEAKNRGYQISGSVLKVDYNGKLFNVGFWIRPNKWDSKNEKYLLPGLCGKTKHKDLDSAIEMAIQKAKENDHDR